VPIPDPNAPRSTSARSGRAGGSVVVAVSLIVISALSALPEMTAQSRVSRSDNTRHSILAAARAQAIVALASSSIRTRFGVDVSTRASNREADRWTATLPPEDLVVPLRSPSERASAEPDPTDAPVALEPVVSAPAGGSTPTPTNTPPPVTPGLFAASDPRVGNDFILISRARLVSLPMSGPAWAQLKSVADENPGVPNLSDLDQVNNVHVLAQALVFARTGNPTYRASVLAQLKAVVGTEGARTLELGRKGAAYVLAADFIDLAGLDPSFDNGTFRPWLRSLLTVQLDGRSLQQTHEERANNWGTHAGATRAAIAAYLHDGAELARTAQVFQGWLGDRGAYAGFSFGDMTWQPNPSAPVPVLPVGAVMGGVSVDGALPEEMRRGDAFEWPPAPTEYPWGALEGATLQAEILHRSGYDAFNWSDRALLRAVRFLFEQAQWRPAGNDQWVFWVIDYRYGTGYRAGAPVPYGKNFGFSDWLYGPAG
jgi:type II secretory pathway pseudopilin PulG